ncbi:hypothetical protein SDC9_150367 [bioreactor metagenome]|uniref:TIGR02453 family protein n=1 Tax=bioreactor metagenome TaxID=1076179 RepID=A0A645ERJ5_9ZZZZ
MKYNNNREWFEDHKNEYKEIQSIFNSFVEKLISGISEFDPTVKKQTVKSCTYRIYRDTRFSKDKSPYKTHMGAFISPQGKCGGFSGYYFHIEANGSDYIGSHILSTGIYMPQPIVLKSIREEISLNGQDFKSLVNTAKGFSLDRSNMLKRVPNGYPTDSVYSDYLKCKDFFLVKRVDDKYMEDESLLKNVVADFNKTHSFNIWLNKAVQYAYETMR